MISFILGCPHSGTSLTLAILSSNPLVYSPRIETESFLPKPKLTWNDLNVAWKASSRPFLIEKTPKHLLYLKKIRSEVPGARFILLVRDGRDVAASLKVRYGSSGAAPWISYCQVVEEEMGSPDCYLLRYEDLITSPRDTVERLCSFLSLPFDEAMMSYWKQPRDWFGATSHLPGNGRRGVEHVNLRSWQINQPIFDGRGRWRTELTDEELKEFDGEGLRLLELFGYVR